MVAVLLIIAVWAGDASQVSARPYKDRPLTDVLKDFQRQGLRVVFSTGLVRPGMRVGPEPHGSRPEDVLAAILAPHDLMLRPGPRGILLVVRIAPANDTRGPTRIR